MVDSTLDREVKRRVWPRSTAARGPASPARRGGGAHGDECMLCITLGSDMSSSIQQRDPTTQGPATTVGWGAAGSGKG